MNKPGRNDPCPCGSGKKYKKCCLAREQAQVPNLSWQKMRRAEGELVPALLKHAERFYGPQSLELAWDEFSLWDDVPMDPESEPELDTIFLPWFAFNWIPDDSDPEEATGFPVMQVALHYLEHKGSRLDSFQRRFIEEVCSQPYSFFTVTEVAPGQRMTLRDLLIPREVTVHERQASAILNVGSIVFTRIMTLDDVSIMVGCAPVAIPPGQLNEFIDFREGLEKKLRTVGRAQLHEYDIELRELYYGIRDELYHPVPPQMQNTDGDPLQLTRLHYSLECTPREALEALATLSMSSAGEFVDEGKFDEQGELSSIEFPWLKKGNRQNAGWDNTVLGRVKIDGAKLVIDVNSRERAEAVQRKVTRRLGKRAAYRNSVIESTEKMLEEMQGAPEGLRASTGPAEEDLEALPELQAKLKEMADQHWLDWLDTELPALKGQTPVEASKTPSGRERLEALLLDFEQRNQSPQPFSPDVEALRRSLGMY